MFGFYTLGARMLLNKKVNKKIFYSVLFFSFLAISIFFTVYPIELGGFKFGHFLLSYESEFLKRGFVGEISRLIFDEVSYSLFNKISYFFIFILFSLFSFLSYLVIYKNHEDTGAWLFLTIFITASFTFQHFYLDLGRFDQILLIIALILIFIINRSIKVFNFIAPAFILILLLIHEAALFIIIPFILGYSFYKDSSKQNIIIILALLLFSLILTSVISINGSMKNMSLEEHHEYLSSSHEEDFGGIYVVHKSGFKENVVKTINRLLTKDSIREHIKLAIFLFPLILVFFPFIFKDIKKNGLSPRHYLLIASLAPLGLYLLGLDFYRWWSLALTNFFIANILILINEDSYRDSLFDFIYKHQLVAIIIIFNSIVFGPMGVDSAFRLV